MCELSCSHAFPVWLTHLVCVHNLSHHTTLLGHCMPQTLWWRKRAFLRWHMTSRSFQAWWCTTAVWHCLTNWCCKIIVARWFASCYCINMLDMDVWGMYVKTWLLHCAAEGEFSNLFTVEATVFGIQRGRNWGVDLMGFCCCTFKNIQKCWWCYTCFILFPGAGFKDFSIWGRLLWVRQDSLGWNHISFFSLPGFVGWNENSCGAWRKEFQLGRNNHGAFGLGLHFAGTWRCGQAWQAGRVCKFASLWCEESWRAAETSTGKHSIVVCPCKCRGVAGIQAGRPILSGQGQSAEWQTSAESGLPLGS